MSGFQTPIKIIEAMENIYHRNYLIPAFQREYVWDAGKGTYPNCNFTTTKFDKDHLLPAASFDEYKKLGGQYEWWQYNSIVNLQLLYANSNKSKNDQPLDEWVNETLPSRPNLKAETYLPVGAFLLLKDFDECYKARRLMLNKQLASVL